MALRPKILLERDIFIASKTHFTFPILIQSSLLQQMLSDCLFNYFRKAASVLIYTHTDKKASACLWNS